MEDKETLLFEVKIDIPGVKEKAELARAAIAQLRAEKVATDKEFRDKTISAQDYAKSMQSIDTQLSRATSQLKGYTKTLADNEKYTKSAKGSNDQLRAELALLVPQLNALGAADRMAEGAAKDLEIRVLSITETLKAQEKAAGDSRRNVGNYGDTMKTTADKIADATSIGKDYVRGINVMGVNVGQVNDAFKAGSSGLGTFTKAVFTGRGALIALGAVPIVLILTGLVTLLTKTQAGMDFVAKAAGAVSGVFNVLIDRGVKLGQAFIDVFTNPKVAIQEFYAAISGISTAMADAASAGIDIVAVNQQIRESERAINVERAKNRAEIERLKQISEDISKTQGERESAAKSAYALENKTLASLVNLQNQRIDNTRREISLGQKTADDKDKLAEQEIRLAEINEESLGKQTELNNQLQQIRLEGIRQALTAALAATNDQIQNLEEVGGVAEKVNTRLLTLYEDRVQKQFELDTAGLSADNKQRVSLEKKLQTDLNQLRHDSVIAYSDLLDRISLDQIETELTNAQEGSIQLLELHKEQIDNQLAMDTAAATRTIKIQEELDAKLALLDAKALKAKQEIDKQIQKQLVGNAQSLSSAALARTRTGTKAELNERMNLVREQAAQELIDAGDNAEKREEIEANLNRALNDMRKEFNRNQVMNVLDSLSSLSDGLDKIAQAQTQREAKLLDDQQSAALKSAGLSVEARTKIEEKFAARKEELDRKSAERQRKIATVQNIIATARAVTEAQILPPPFDIIKTVLAIATGAAQQAVIASQQFARGGVIAGKSHKEGGIKYNVQGRSVELEGGEGVINKHAMAIPFVRQKASELNQMAGNGIAFPGTSSLRQYTPARMELGGVVSGANGGATIDYNQLGQVVSGMVLRAVQSLPPAVVRVSSIRSEVGKEVRVENRADISIRQ